jgi:outer membrane protein insertion porin family
VNLTISVDEDRKFYVNRISFSGNTTTRDKVIRRELAIQEGEVFNSTLWDRSLLKLNQLGYFDELRPQDAEMNLNPADDTVDINVKIREKERKPHRIQRWRQRCSAGGFLGLNYSTNEFPWSR